MCYNEHMKRFTKILTTALATLAFACIPTLSANVADTTVTAYAASYHTTTPTEYKTASDVNYKTAGGYTVNWGARGEDCTFLSSRAVNFYTGNNTFASLSQKGGSTNLSSVPSSALYNALQDFMIGKHTKLTSYSGTKDLYKYTDCVSNGYNQYISSFYSGTHIGPEWGSSPTWNREHTWPKSKGIGEGSDAANDIMMLRPTAQSENSSRGNTAYGESTGYYDPNECNGNVRGDCARIVLYMYVRWESLNTTSSMWGTGGVMESMDVLLKWMQEDPVDTWEMGRNDAVQSITGTRNVFVDYPEFAWLLFGKSIPTGFNTPSGIANGGSVIPPAVDPDLPDTPDTPDVPELPAAGSTVSIADALAIGGAMTHDTTTAGKYYLTGKVADISNTEYGNMNIQDDSDNKIYIYGTWSADGKTRFDSLTTKPKVGDTITVYSVIGNYNGAQLKNAWITSINGGSTPDAPDTPDTPDTPVTPPSGGDVTTGDALATFDFGANGSASHKDGSPATSTSYTSNGYTLKITDGVQFYTGAFDAQGNSCLKLGSGKSTGSFNFTVPSDVVSVTFEIAGYKNKTSKVTINSQTYTISGASDNGEYDTITVDTTSTKTISVATVSGGTRVMINTISFIGAETPDVPDTPDTPVVPDTPDTPTDSTPIGDSTSDSTPDINVSESDEGCSSSVSGIFASSILCIGALFLLKKKEN